MAFAEPWIEKKLRDRLEAYKRKHPAFNVDRFMDKIKTSEAKFQRFSPYMKDDDIRSLNVSMRKSRSIDSLAKNDHL